MSELGTGRIFGSSVKAVRTFGPAVGLVALMLWLPASAPSAAPQEFVDAQIPGPQLALKLKPGRLKRGADGKLYLDPESEGNDLKVCTRANFTDDCHFSSIGKAVSKARFGDTVVVGPGIYKEAIVIRKNGVTIKAEPGAHLKGVAAEGKGAIVIKGKDTVIEGLECSGIQVADGNGACVRLEGANLTLRNVYFHDSQEGLLGGKGKVLIEDSRFERLGRGGQAHGMYVGGQEFILRRSQVLASQGEGHEVKSRAARTVIEDSVIASLDGADSRLIDVANGGEVIIRNNVLEIGPNSVNRQLIGVGLEKIKFEKNSVLIEGNLIIMDRRNPLLFKGRFDATIRNNVIVGGQAMDGNTWHPNRKAAGLAAYPYLPKRTAAGSKTKVQRVEIVPKSSGPVLNVEREDGAPPKPRRKPEASKASGSKPKDGAITEIMPEEVETSVITAQRATSSRTTVSEPKASKTKSPEAKSPEPKSPEPKAAQLAARPAKPAIERQPNPRLLELAANQWVKIDQFDDATWSRQRHAGLAFDSRRGTLLIFGSDTHGRDWDNAVHEFDPARGTWESHHPPSDKATYRGDALGNRIAGEGHVTPWAMHTYDCVVYDPRLDALLVIALPGHHPLWKDVTEATHDPIWLYDLRSRQWQVVAVTGVAAPQIFAGACAYDAGRDVIVAYEGTGLTAYGTKGRRLLWELGPDRQEWRQAARGDHKIHYTMAYDNLNRKLVVFGDRGGTKQISVYSPGARAGEAGTWENRTPEGDDCPGGASFPAAFDATHGVFVLLPKGVTCLYDVATNRITRLPLPKMNLGGMNYMLAHDALNGVFFLVTGERGQPVTVWAMRLDLADLGS